jgi:hypothetical protein
MLKPSAFWKCIGVSYTGISLHVLPSMMLPKEVETVPGHQSTSLSLRNEPILSWVEHTAVDVLIGLCASFDTAPSRLSGKKLSRNPWYLTITRTQGLPFVVILQRSLEHLINASYCIRMRSRPLPWPAGSTNLLPGNTRSTTTHRHCLRTTGPTLAILSLCALLALLSSVSWECRPGLACWTWPGALDDKSQRD